ncbi:hypothetical protein EU803_12835 [Loktanella sp. IMCC34160]|uniref:hypothetical protein n=1 Tax=Loktanella sp. IMCC34160 TaxID=2510646 RepID=UPI0010D1A19F|nr:hypothetical protein [Loktanella sp. IMCC34160]RYG90870.1 hypothetical protein EU803_12835 [Loktanella sp. IMCC34160]
MALIRATRAIFLAAVVVGLAGPVAAQDIRMQMTSVGATHVLEFENSSGLIIQQRLFALGDGTWREERTEVQGGDVVVTDRMITNADGNVLQADGPDGAIIRFIPHDCRRVEGTCEYVQIVGDQPEELGTRLVRRNTPTEKGYIAELAYFGPDGVLLPYLRSVVVLDDGGFVMRADRTYSDGSRYSYWRVGPTTGS